MKNILTTSFITLFICSISAQFSGEIVFKKNAGDSEINYTYFVNNDNIKVEEKNSDGKIDGIKLINLTSKKTNILSPERKLYLVAPERRQPADVKVKIDKTNKTKTILNQECEKIIVTCEDQDRKIIYWVAKGDYDFFIPMLKIINRREKAAVYFQKILGLKGSWPMESYEYVLSTSKLISEMTTISIERKTISLDTFIIPTDYQEFKD